MIGRSLYVTANRLRLHLIEWGRSGPTVLLLHGFLEHAHAWDWVAPQLAEAGYHVFALDWRGHGDSDRVGAGGYYHFPDYVADLAGIVRELGGRAAMIAHSMGGGAAILYAGTEPERVTALVSIEGLGIPRSGPETAPERFADWLKDLEKVRRRPAYTFPLEFVVERIRARFPLFPETAVQHMAWHGTREAGGQRAWKFDPLHQSRAPLPTPEAYARAFWERVACPVLYVEGASGWLRGAEEIVAERLRVLRARRVTIPDCGHHPHLERPEELSQLLVSFLAEVLPTERLEAAERRS